MSDRPVNLSSSGPPATVIDPEPADALAALDAAVALPEADRRAAVAAVAVRWPRCLIAWATLGDLARDDAEAYACYRVGYHRGLDRLRASGWRGTGYVRWSHPENHGVPPGPAGARAHRRPHRRGRRGRALCAVPRPVRSGAPRRRVIAV